MSVGTGRQNIIILIWKYSFISGNPYMGTRHLYWILTGTSFAVQEEARLRERYAREPYKVVLWGGAHSDDNKKCVVFFFATSVP
jgi:hypothetical protein